MARQKYQFQYDGDRKIEASGELPGGQSFNDIVGLKKILLERKEQFARALTNKLLGYAIGRPIELTDRPHIDQIVDELTNRDFGMRDLINLVVLSEPFRSM